MPLATTTTFDSTSAGAQLFVSQRIERRGVSITNTDANALYVIIGSTTVSSTSHTAAIPTSGLYETPVWYNGEKIAGIWAANGAGYAHVTEWL